MHAPRAISFACDNFFSLKILWDKLSQLLLDRVSQTFHQMVGIWSMITDLILLFRSLKGRCHGNQFWGKIANPTFIRPTVPPHWRSNWDCVTPDTIGAAAENWDRISVSKEIGDKPEIMPKWTPPRREWAEASHIAMPMGALTAAMIWLHGANKNSDERTRDFEPIHKVRHHASTGSKASGVGDKTPWSWRIFIKQIRNSNISKEKRNSLWSCFPNLWSWSKNNFANARRSSPSVVKSRPTTAACRSHSASSFAHSTTTTGCDATRRAVRWCQPRLVLPCDAMLVRYMLSCICVSVWHTPVLCQNG